MEKRPGSYAVFDVAKAPLLALMSDWRRDNAKLGLDGSLQGVFARCEDAETATFETWRAGDAKSARLLSLFSHGSAGTLEGCTKAPLYVEAECATYPEVPGAVIHLLACESLLELAPALVAAGADAVIGYSEPFALVYTPADADEIAQGRLPASIASALACDNQVLLALAGGESVASAVEAAKSWAASEGERLAAAATQVRLTEDGLRAFAARQANLATNASFLGYCGHAEATITVTGRTQTMSNARTLLLYLVADLMRAEVGAPIPKFDNLIEDFKKDPEKVMTAYGVDDDARVVLFTMDRQLIGEYLRQEVLRTPAPPPVSLWAEPLPRIQSVEPKVLVTAPDQKLELTVDCILSTAEVHLVSDDSLNHIVARPKFSGPVQVLGQKVAVTFDLSHATPDDYRVLVYNSASASPIDSGLMVKVNAPVHP